MTDIGALMCSVSGVVFGSEISESMVKCRHLALDEFLADSKSVSVSVELIIDVIMGSSIYEAVLYVVKMW